MAAHPVRSRTGDWGAKRRDVMKLCLPHLPAPSPITPTTNIPQSVTAMHLGEAGMGGVEAEGFKADHLQGHLQRLMTLPG